MNIKSAVGPIVTLVGGILLLSIVVSALLVLFYGPREKEVTVYVEKPWYRNYHGWWGYPNAGLPGWGPSRHPPGPPPHPKPPAPTPPPPVPSPSPAPAQPPPANPPA
jgi:hypothetical protein